MAAPPMLLVTGATGLVMSHMVREWLGADPAARVLAVDLNPPDAVVQAFFEPVVGRIDFRQGSVADEAFWAALGQTSVTHIVHGATVTSIRRMTTAAGLAGALPALETNIMGTARLLAWAQQQPELDALVAVSSGSVYADKGPSPLPEEGYVAPEGLYAFTKWCGETLALEAARDFGLPAIAVRLSGVYGPLDRETGFRGVKPVPFTLLRRALDGQPTALSGLKAIGDYIHAGDVARAIRALLTAPRRRWPVYNIALGETWSLQALADLVMELVPGSNWHETPAETADLVGEEFHLHGRWGAYDLTRIRADTGWRPRALPEAFATYRDWLARQPY